MVYRELRNFSELLKALGYPREISIDRFRKPDFPTIGDIMRWLINRVDPSIEIPLIIDTEQDRVIFVKTCVQLLSNKASISLDPKKIYSADHEAVLELNKLAALLYKASKTSDDDTTQSEESLLNEEFLTSKSNELKKARQLASKITQRGAILSDLLEKEIELREKRSNVLERQSEITTLEKAIYDDIKSMEKEIENITFKIENVASDEANLEAKIEKKRQDLERYQKRLLALKSVRPAYMDEYEKYQEEMATLYQSYVVKYRNMVYLEDQLENYDKIESENMKARDEQVKRMIEKMRDEENLRLNDDSSKEFDAEINGYDEEDDNEESPAKVGLQSGNRAQRPLLTTSTSRRQASPSQAKIFGDVFGDDKDDSLDSDLSLGPDEDQSELDTEDERELMNINDINQRNRKEEEDDDF